MAARNSKTSSIAVSLDLVDMTVSGRGRKPSPLNATFDTLWGEGKGKGFAIPADHSETHENSKGESKTHEVSPFNLYAWAKRSEIAVTVRTRPLKNGKGNVLVVTPKAAKK